MLLDAGDLVEAQGDQAAREGQIGKSARSANAADILDCCALGWPVRMAQPDPPNPSCRQWLFS